MNAGPQPTTDHPPPATRHPPMSRSAPAAQLESFRRRGWRPGVLPGFTPTLGMTVLYLTAIVLLPLGAMILRTLGLSWGEFWCDHLVRAGRWRLTS